MVNQELLYDQQNLVKFKEMYLYILSNFKNGISKIKLANLLYLADFKHFYENLEPMSGVNYFCKTYGPLADAFLFLTDEMIDNNQIKTKCLSDGSDLVFFKQHL